MPDYSTHVYLSILHHNPYYGGIEMFCSVLYAAFSRLSMQKPGLEPGFSSDFLTSRA